MSIPPIPVIFEPLFKPKPWGGRKLAELFGKALPGAGPIGESWELVSLAGNESRVRRGPLAGRTVSELIEMWGPGLYGGAELVAGRFPLLIKFLDARQPLSVQVHPKPDAGGSAGAAVKHEAWYVIDAAPGAELFIGFKPGVGPNEARAAANTRAIADLLQRRPAKPGQCYYLPSGTPHALGPGIVVAEVQTPSDVTYRLYDWDRMGLDGGPRELHVEAALSNAIFDLPEERIVQTRTHVGGLAMTVSRLVACGRFLIDKVRLCEGTSQGIPHSEMVIWIVLRGRGVLAREQFQCEYRSGDVVVIPAESAQTRVRTECDNELLEVKIPIASDLAGYTRPPRERAARPGQALRLTTPNGPRPRG